MFLVTVIVYLVIYLSMLIRDLDNPFGYYERYSGEDVSLKPLEDTAHRLAQMASVEIASRTGSAEQCAAPDTDSPRR